MSVYLIKNPKNRLTKISGIKPKKETYIEVDPNITIGQKEVISLSNFQQLLIEAVKQIENKKSGIVINYYIHMDQNNPVPEEKKTTTIIPGGDQTLWNL